MTSVVLAGGGSAGHVLPLLSVADALSHGDDPWAVTVLGSPGGLEERLVPEAGYRLVTIPRVPFPRRPNLDVPRFPVAFGRAVQRTRTVLQDAGAEVVVGFGGYVSTPAYLAARLLRLPIVVHEANVHPGLANRLGARLTPHVAVGFPGTDLPHAQVTGNPLRPQVATLDRAEMRAPARDMFGLRHDLPVVLVTGGSLGAVRLNEAFAAAAPALRASGVQVLHITGLGKEVSVVDDSQVPYVVRGYWDQMELAYAAADLVVCRAGAGMVSELSAVGLPGVYVPLPVGNGEQRRNAAVVVAAGGGILVEDAEVDATWVEQSVIPLARHEERLRAMGAAALTVGVRDADQRVADMVRRAVEGRR